MTSEEPTALAVSSATRHYRQQRDLSRDELSYVLGVNDHPMSTADIAAIEHLDREVTVDDLMALACALDVSPAALLSHVPEDMPILESPLATGTPADVSPRELEDWVCDRTALDGDTRVQWWTNEVARLRVRSAHHDEQLDGAYQHYADMSAGTYRTGPSTGELTTRIRDLEFEQNQADVALAIAEQQLDDLTEKSF